MTKWVNVVVIYSRYPKRQVIVSLRVITKVFLPRHSNVSLENGKKLCVQVPKENHANARGSASWTEHLQYPLIRRTEKQWHNMSRCFVNCTPDVGSSFLQTTESICCATAFQNIDLSSRFCVRHWTNAVNALLLITHINAATFFSCIFNGSQQIYSFFHLCHYSMARLAALWLIPMGSTWLYGNVPLLHALVSGIYLVYPALLIHWSNFADTRPSLATKWGSI